MHDCSKQRMNSVYNSVRFNNSRRPYYNSMIPINSNRRYNICNSKRKFRGRMNRSKTFLKKFNY